jgi:hypothetical protein
VACEVAPLEEIVKITAAAWHEVSRGAFESAWIVTGYFQPSHFQQIPGVEHVATTEEAQHFLDPTGLLAGGQSCLKPTPQFCEQYQWQLQD